MEEVKIPVIDLLRSPAENEKLLEACQGIGCFRVVNHGIPAELQAEMKAAVRSLFDLPDDVKCRTADVTPGRGYSQRTEQNRLWEAFGLYDAASLADVDRFCSQLQASPETREIIKTYASRLHDLTVNIAIKIAESLGLCDYSFNDWPCRFRMNKYHFTEETTIGSTGIKTHTDSGFLTVLQEDDNVGGLEIMDMSGKFVAVHPVPGSLLVNLGDTAKAWSNGRLHNVKHRVVCKEAAGPRLTIAFFLLAPKDDKVEAPAALVDADHPRLYRTFTYEEYFKLLISTMLFDGEALALLTLPQAP